ncbi:iron uptake system component EfeO [Novosphingobium sp. PhB55]|uniref:iron uptake system protein EfeO n=1 Tax=Novosphingobium sp. PhB55 TaxID=2485106 RepID=UPI0010661038|nr:iron uptake system protein EfeO [Novosphingobium sp. PhB55]TDW61452.1 iron uptake system component EfeO [Novosphingobium sp. PhB55]
MTKTSSSPLIRAALVGSALLVLLGGIAFWYASNRSGRTPRTTDGHAVTVTIRGKVCDPNDITVPAGKTTFTIVNETQRALEWEILDGVMVIDERENIAPGLRQTMTVKLEPGEYDITCGLLNNPRGKLHVTPSTESDAEAARPSLETYVGPLAEYQVYLLTEAETLDSSAQALVAALKAGQLDKARELYAPAHQSYVRIEAAGQVFGDLEARLNARADYYEKKAADPAFQGFRRIEYGLANGSDARALGPVGDKLLADIATLKERLAGIELKPEQLAGFTEKQFRRLSDSLGAALSASGPATGDDSPADLQGLYESGSKVAELLSPLLVKANPALDKAFNADFAAFDKALAPLRTGDTMRAVKLDLAQRRAMAAILAKIAADFGKTNAALGLT